MDDQKRGSKAAKWRIKERQSRAAGREWLKIFRYFQPWNGRKPPPRPKRA